jgi:hypothetical protein
VEASLDCANRILVEGTLPADAGQQFESYLRVRFDMPPSGMRVCFNSPGGRLVGGMSLGRVIRRYNFDTCIERTYSSMNQALAPERQSIDSVFVDNARCTSACVLAFMGGFDRIVSEDAALGVHQFAGLYGPLGDSFTQVTQTQLAEYFDEMRVSRRLLDMASLVPPTSIRWLTREEARSLLLDTTGGSMTPWTLRTDANGLLSAQAAVTHADFRGFTLLSISSRVGETALDVHFAVGDGNRAAALQALQNTGQVRLSIDQAIVAELPSNGWTKAEDLFVTIRLPLKPSIRELLVSGYELEFSVGPSDCCGRYDPSVTVPLSDLRRFLPAVMRPSPGDDVAPSATGTMPRAHVKDSQNHVRPVVSQNISSGAAVVASNAVPILIRCRSVGSGCVR